MYRERSCFKESGKAYAAKRRQFEGASSFARTQDGDITR